MELVRIEIGLLMRDALVVAEPSDEHGGLPKRLAPVSRVPPRHTRALADATISLGPARDIDYSALFKLYGSGHVALLAIRISDADFKSTLLRAQPLAESIIDDLSFQMQTAIQPLWLTLLDVTPTVKFGEKRDCATVVNPMAVLLPKFYSNPLDMSIQDISVDVPSLNKHLYTQHQVKRNLRVALWWYVKAMAAPYLVDQLVCLFTAVEQLSKLHLTGPYKTNCNHEIARCPVCNASMHRPLVGVTIKNYLTQTGGLSKKEADELWKVRQLIHGKDVFTPEQLNHISPLTGLLRQAVHNGLKAGFGLRATEAPHLTRTGGPVFGATIELSGKQEIDNFDIELESDIDSAQQGCRE